MKILLKIACFYYCRHLLSTDPEANGQRLFILQHAANDTVRMGAYSMLGALMM
jgi:hypothetical protein